MGCRACIAELSGRFGFAVDIDGDRIVVGTDREGINAMLATLVFDREFEVTHLEMMKGIRDTGYHDRLVVPIIDNTAHECDLADAMASAMADYPATQAVLVRRHGVYVWGRDWVEAKTQAECYDYLFEAAVRMKQLGHDPSTPEKPNAS